MNLLKKLFCEIKFVSLHKKNFCLFLFYGIFFVYWFLWLFFVYWVLWLFFVYNRTDQIIDHSTVGVREGGSVVLSSPPHSIVLYLREGRSGLPCPESGETELDESCQWVSSRVLKDEVELYYEISLRVEVPAYNSSWNE